MEAGPGKQGVTGETCPAWTSARPVSQDSGPLCPFVSGSQARVAREGTTAKAWRPDWGLCLVVEGGLSLGDTAERVESDVGSRPALLVSPLGARLPPVCI